MAYWSKSFGFYLTLGASGFYFIFLAIFYAIDGQTVPKILDRLIARVKRLELKGFKQKEAKKLTVYRDEKGKIVFIRHDKKKDENGQPEDGDKEAAAALAIADAADEKQKGFDPDAVIELKKAGIDVNELKGKKYGDEENVAEAYLTPAKGKKLKGRKAKIA